MTAPLHRLGFTALRYASRTPAPARTIKLSYPSRQFHRNSIYQARKEENEEDEEDEEDGEESQPPQPPVNAIREPFNFDVNDLAQEERNIYESLPPSEQEEWREEARLIHEYMAQPDVASELTGEVSKLANEFLEEMPRRDPDLPRIKPGLLAMGEDDEQAVGEDPEFEGDDITSLAHGELEQHREMRQYARIAVWEMPLLYSTLNPSTQSQTRFPPLLFHIWYMAELTPQIFALIRTSKTLHSPTTNPPSSLPLHNLHG